jgi:hypothetical protein
MIGYILTLEQKNQIQGKEFLPSQHINCVIDINNIWFTFLSEQQKKEILDTDWNWILTLPQGEYIPKPNTPFSI